MDDSWIRLHRQMVLLRRFETRVGELYRAGELPGFVHLYVGEEAVAAGVCSRLRGDDWITSTHRGHGHALAKGLPPGELMAELHGRAGGCCGGRGGSMHLYAPRVGILGTNGFVGGGIPAAVGIGLSAATRGTDQVAAAFFGDGALNHGAFHESMNLAAAFSLPVVFVCEHNLYATATPLAAVVKEPEVSRRAAGYGVPAEDVDGNDVVAVAEASGRAVERARAGGGPTLLVCHTYRTVGHHEGDPPVGTYRTAEELEGWKRRCPIERHRRRLLAADSGLRARLEAIDREVDEEVRAAVEFARASPWPDPATVHDHVTAGSGSGDA
ncbi:MAG: thiamine pyrophosphate-dependent dehydrogenase E1 component subunit alpha [Thermoanaerobaculia bacterium]